MRNKNEIIHTTHFRWALHGLHLQRTLNEKCTHPAWNAFHTEGFHLNALKMKFSLSPFVDMDVLVCTYLPVCQNKTKYETVIHI